MQYPIIKKFTKETRARIRNSIRQTQSDGKEHGFALCSNSEISPHIRECVGDKCSVYILDSGCKEKTQGNFHVHPIKDKYFEYIQLHKLPDTIRNRTEFMEYFGKPSVQDLVVELKNKKYGFSEGSVCTSTDLDDKTDWHILSCYTVKEDIVKEDLDILGMFALSKISKNNTLFRKYFNEEHDLVYLGHDK